MVVHIKAVRFMFWWPKYKLDIIIGPIGRHFRTLALLQGNIHFFVNKTLQWLTLQTISAPSLISVVNLVLTALNITATHWILALGKFD